MNCWYMGGWSEEVGPDVLFARTLAGHPIVMFRDPTGELRAIYDRCPHRFAPLSLGLHLGDRIQCQYHGLQFDGSGKCIHSPHGDGKVPPGVGVRAFPVVERAGCIWLWPGDPALADPASIPDFDCLDQENNYVGHGYIHAPVDYTLETDNIMDLSHIEFLHPGTLGSAVGAVAETHVQQEGSTVWSIRVTRGEVLAEFLEKVFGVPHGQPVDRWLKVRWDPPSSMLLTITVVAAGGRPEDGRARRVANIFSPETETSTHYWFSVSYDKAALGPDGHAIAAAATEALRAPFLTEDLPMVEAVQRSMDGAGFWSLRPAILQSDTGAVRARRVLDKLIRDDAERQPAVQPNREAGRVHV